jgi:LmbE family N-acetylglucosaminyl deacetylase
MSTQDLFSRGEAFSQRLGSFERPLLMVAHHDDEVPVAGLLQRMGPATRVVWTTNSDGLYFQSDLAPADYAEVRKAEGVRSTGLVGIPASGTTCLDFSEVEIYRRMSALHAGTRSVAEVRPFFDEIRAAVRDVVLDIRPDVVVTLAWQGGQPEHDLTHFFTMLALRDLVAETGRRAAFYHFPAYEYTILLAMRFHPLYRGERLRIRLTPEELARKHEMIAAYPSQEILFTRFRQLFRYLLRPLGLLTGGPRSTDDFLSVEEFGPVPAGLDYAAPPHLLDFFTYMFDDFEGVPVTFSGSVRPLVRSFLDTPD